VKFPEKPLSVTVKTLGTLYEMLKGLEGEEATG